MVVPAATAQTTDDPAAGSPPRAVYQIPLEGGRSDAAPRKRSEETAPSAGGGNDGSGGSSSGSVYRSENDFGSSSQVPGAQGRGDDVLSGASADKGTTSKAAAAIPAPAPADDGDTSVPTAVWLLALIAVSGVVIGIKAVRSARRGY